MFHTIGTLRLGREFNKERSDTENNERGVHVQMKAWWGVLVVVCMYEKKYYTHVDQTININ